MGVTGRQKEHRKATRVVERAQRGGEMERKKNDEPEKTSNRDIDTRQQKRAEASLPTDPAAFGVCF